MTLIKMFDLTGNILHLLPTTVVLSGQQFLGWIPVWANYQGMWVNKGSKCHCCWDSGPSLPHMSGIPRELLIRTLKTDSPAAVCRAV